MTEGWVRYKCVVFFYFYVSIHTFDKKEANQPRRVETPPFSCIADPRMRHTKIPNRQ